MLEDPRLRFALMTSVALVLGAGATAAQSAATSQKPMAQPGVATDDEVVVTGIRATQRNSIAVERDASVNITDNVQARIQPINIGDEHQNLDRPVGGSVAETIYFGPSYFAGIRVHF